MREARGGDELLPVPREKISALSAQVRRETARADSAEARAESAEAELERLRAELARLGRRG